MTDIGFTGSRLPAADEQEAELNVKLARLWRRGASFHHGDCVNGDATAHRLAWLMDYRIVVHPPRNPKHRAWVNHGEYWAATRDVVLAEKEYLTRNADIVAAIEHLVAMPFGSERDSPRSGTWSCVRLAERLAVPVTIILPPGVKR